MQNKMLHNGPENLSVLNMYFIETFIILLLK